MRVSIDKREFRSLNAVRGLPPDAHLLIMCARSTPTGATLEGSEQAFDELVSFISGEIADEMVPETEMSSLSSLCVRIDPGCADWLGM
jgi:hypothetical protein